MIDLSQFHIWTEDEFKLAFPPAPSHSAKPNGAGSPNGAQAQGRAQPAEPDEINEADLTDDLREWVQDGVPEGEDRSVVFFKVVRALKRLGYSAAAIFELFERYPDGVAQKYLDESASGSPARLQREVERAYDKPPRAAPVTTPATPLEPEDPAEVVEPYNFWPDTGPLVMPEDLLPQRIESYARSASIVVGADEGGFAMAALTVVAGSIDDAIKLQVLPHSKWLERARLWNALVGDPSSKKSPIISTTCEALEDEDARLWRGYQAQRDFWNVLSKADKARTPPPVRQRYIVGDATVEALQEAFKHTTRGLLGLHDELGGWFAQMDRYNASKQGAADRSFMLKAYNGGRCPVDRIGRGESLLENVSLTILGGIQPEVLSQFAGSGVDDGLIQRLMPIMLRPGWPPQTDQAASEALSDFDALIPQILALGPPTGGCLRFDDGAQAIRDNLALEHDRMSAAFAGVNKKLSTALAKQDAVFARLCVVWHCVEHADNRRGLPERVTEDTARRVAAFMDDFTRPHLFDFYGIILEVPEEHERLVSIAGYILTKKLKVLANWRMQKAVWSLRKLTSKDITPVMETLEALGWLRRSRSRSRFGAPPTWLVNPAVHDGRFAERGEREAKRREEAYEIIKKAAAKRRQGLNV
jgi:Protein of unknown function (DUF3987)